MLLSNQQPRGAFDSFPFQVLTDRRWMVFLLVGWYRLQPADCHRPDEGNKRHGNPINGSDQPNGHFWIESRGGDLGGWEEPRPRVLMQLTRETAAGRAELSAFDPVG